MVTVPLRARDVVLGSLTSRAAGAAAWLVVESGRVHAARMLAEFVSANRAVIVARAQARVAVRTSPKPSAAELSNGIPVFLDQLCDALRLAEVSDEIDHKALSKSARRHGGDLLRMGLTVAQVVHDYGDVCQAITNLAVEQE